MGIEHISAWRNLCQALPPKYTEHVAKCFFDHMERKTNTIDQINPPPKMGEQSKLLDFID